MESIDVAQVLMLWEPDDRDRAMKRVKRSIQSFAAACDRSDLRGAILLADGAFDAAHYGGRLREISKSEVIACAGAVAESSGIEYGELAWQFYAHGWPSEAVKLTYAMRAAALMAPVIIRLDSDETIDEQSDLGAAIELMRGRHGALIEWDTVGEQAHGSQDVGSKRHLRMFASNPTLTAGPAYHGSYKVYDGEWLALRMRGEENTGLQRARVVDASNLVRIVNHPAERSAAMHEAKARLLAHRYSGALSDR